MGKFGKLNGGKENRSLIIKEKSLVSLIIRSYADDEKRKFLNKTVNRPRTILDIIALCGLPQTSSYRKINSMITDGLLIPVSQSSKYGKQIKKYVSLFENLEINIVKNEIVINAKLNEDAYQAIFDMMRAKIINVHQKQKMSGATNYQVIQKNIMSVPSDTIIPFLLKERIIKI